MRSSGNPLDPTLEEAMDRALTAEERRQFVDHLRPLVEGGHAVRREALAYLSARKG